MLKLKVEEMSCSHCVSAVQKAVRSVDPAAEVNVDLAGGTVSVETAAEESRISGAIRQAGYPNRKLTA
jgi:copper chaperone